jgi:hypothetical protein
MADTDTIRDMAHAVLDKIEKEQILSEKVHDIKTDCTIQVEAEYEETKDKALSNASKRGIEVDMRLEGDEEYLSMVNSLNVLRLQIKRDVIDLEFQKREFQRSMKE